MKFIKINKNEDFLILHYKAYKNIKFNIVFVNKIKRSDVSLMSRLYIKKIWMVDSCTLFFFS